MRDWWAQAYQRGCGIVIVCEGEDDIGKYMPFVDEVYDLRGRFGSSAYQTVAIVIGIDVTSIPESVMLERADFASLHMSVRPGTSISDVMIRLSKLAGYDVADIETVLPGIGSTPDKPRLRDLCGYGTAKDWGMQLAEDFAAYRRGTLDWDDMDRGILLSGPPGCGKSYFARALAEECGVPLVMCSYADIEANTGSGNLTNKAIKKIWADARKKAPCIVFMDELDSVGARGDRGNNNGWWTSIINGLLAELDGAEPREGVVAIGATNFPDAIDRALRRPGPS